jgi:hypothetical protein
MIKIKFKQLEIIIRVEIINNKRAACQISNSKNFSYSLEMLENRVLKKYQIKGISPETGKIDFSTSCFVPSQHQLTTDDDNILLTRILLL